MGAKYDRGFVSERREAEDQKSWAMEEGGGRLVAVKLRR